MCGSFHHTADMADKMTLSPGSGSPSLSSSKNKVKINAKKARLQEVYDHIAVMSDEIKEKAKQLKADKEANTANRTHKSRLMSHTSSLTSDHQLRPSDRSYEIRTYSRMDLDVWKYNDVRNWFNQYATDVPVEHMSPADTGYMIRK